jgi:hypothetical protein
VNLRKDHLAGGAFVLAGAVVGLLSFSLPFGTLTSPGAGMLPILLIGFLTAFGILLFVRAGESPPLARVDWSDFRHALPVVVVAAVAVAAYTQLGFLITIPLMLFFLTFIVERRPLLSAAAFSIGVSAIAYALFGVLLKSPLPRGILGF